MLGCSRLIHPVLVGDVTLFDGVAESRCIELESLLSRGSAEKRRDADDDDGVVDVCEGEQDVERATNKCVGVRRKDIGRKRDYQLEDAAREELDKDQIECVFTQFSSSKCRSVSSPPFQHHPRVLQENYSYYCRIASTSIFWLACSVLLQQEQGEGRLLVAVLVIMEVVLSAITLNGDI